MRLACTALLILLLAPLAAPLAAAADDPATPIQPLLPRLGDRLLYTLDAEERVLDADGRDITGIRGRLPFPGLTTTLVTIEGVASARDEYGLPRETVAFRIERARDDRIVSVERCYLDAPLGWATRWEYVDGGPRHTNEWTYYERELPLLGGGARYYNTSPVVAFRTDACDGHWRPGYADFRPGERVHVASLLGGSSAMPSFRYASESIPSRATTFEGTPAMAYVFPLASWGNAYTTVSGTLEVVFAHALPGPVLVAMHQREASPDEVREVRATLRLTGFEPGSQPFPWDLPYVPHPEENPGGHMRDHDPRTFDDAALGLPYPYADAVRALANDPTLAMSRYLAERPQAALRVAEYADPMEVFPQVGPLSLRDARSVRGPGWHLCFADAETSACATTVRPADGGGAATVNADAGTVGAGSQALAPYRAIGSEGLARLLEAEGIPAGTIRGIRVDIVQAHEDVRVHAEVSQVPWTALAEGDGLVAALDLDVGTIRQVSSASARIARGGMLSAASPPAALHAGEAADTRAAGWSALGLPAHVGATAAAAATGLALLALLAKFVLLPFYTRLRRDRMLDNPTRARLYERVRAEPGTHLAELVDYAGIGKGAARHHLDQLVAHRFLVEVRVGEFLRYYAAGEVPPDVARRAGVLRAGSHQRVYDLFAAQPETSLRDAARRLGMSAPSVHRAKKRLEAEGLLPAAKQGVVEA